nr:MAG TPA: Receptor tyrosine-protein kinase erbB-2, ErbB2, Tyrosine kinase, Activation [Caudoviricetes sp.]
MLLASTNMSAIPIWLLGWFLFALLIIGIVKFLRRRK